MDLSLLYGMHYLDVGNKLVEKLGQILPGLLLLGLAALACIRQPRIGTLLLGALAFGAPLVVFMFGVFGRPMWLERTVSWTLPLGLTLAAAAMLELRPRWLRTATVVGVLVIAIANVALLYSSPQREPYREAMALIEAARQPGDAILFVPQNGIMSLTYYQARRGIGMDSYAITPRIEPKSQGGMPYDALKMRPPLIQSPTYLKLNQLDQITEGHQRVWVLYRRKEFSDPHGAVQAWLEKNGHQVSDAELQPKLELVLVDLSKGKQKLHQPATNVDDSSG
jgi:hypothetical protein